MKDLKMLLGNAPSVKRFNELLAGLSLEERKSHYHRVYHLAMQQWEGYPKKYRRFFIDFIRHDWQGFADYLHSETALGELRHPVEDEEELKKLFHLMAQSQTNHKVSYNHLSFCILVSFKVSLKISVLGDQIRCKSFYPEEMLDMLQYVQILN
jgi:hypothetical protein